MKKQLLRALFLATAFILAVGVAFAADWPPKKLTIIIPHEVGSNSDSTTRLIGKYWSKHMPEVEQIIYVNKGQAGGRPGYDQFAASPRDGSVLLSCNLQTAAILWAQQKPDWKWEEVMYPINVYDMDPAVIQVNKNSPYQSLAELLEAAKTKPMVAGVSRWATTDTLVIYQLMEYTGAKFEVVPLGNASNARAALLGGHVDFCTRRASDVKIDSANIRGLSINLPTNPIKHVLDIPTTQDVVGKPIVSAGSYRVFAAHPDLKRDHPERFQQLWDTLKQIKSDPEFYAEAKKLGFELMDDMTPEDLIAMSTDLFEVFAKYEDVYKKKQ